MILETGYVYHIKNNNSKILCFIPMSSKVEKYRKLQEENIQKNGVCDTIVIGKYRRKDSAFLIQNIFPITEKYIDHIDTIRNQVVPVVEGTQKEITTKVNKIFKLKSRRN